MSARSHSVLSTAVIAILFVVSTPGSAEAAPGALDPSFSHNGKVVIDFNGQNDTANDLALQTDGKIVLAGGASEANRDGFALARLKRGGILDRSFGEAGKVRTEIGALSEIQAVKVQLDGRIVAARLYHG
jgi:uncharacterized delta-60 repeat protein